MNKLTMSPDWIKENGQKIRKAYEIALSQKYDIYSETQVIEILKIVDPINANEEYAESFSKALQLLEHRLLKTTNKEDQNKVSN